MNYLEDVADAIRSGVPSELLPDLDTTDLFRIYAVLALAKGEGVALEDVHNAWSAWMSGQDPRHQAIRPLAELSADVQAADEPYLEAIRRAARRLGP